MSNKSAHVKKKKNHQLAKGRLLLIILNHFSVLWQASKGEQVQVDGNLFSTSSLSYIIFLPLLETCFLPGQYRHARHTMNTPLCVSSSSAGARLPVSCPWMGSLSKKLLPTNPVVCISPYLRSATQSLNSIFFKCCINEILECAPFCSYPS